MLAGNRKPIAKRMFWDKLSKIILNNRKAWLGFLFVTTLFMGYMASKITLSYELAKILPQSDASFKRYEEFKKRFGEDGSVMVIAIESDKIYELKTFNAWYDLNKKIKSHDGIKGVVSNANLFSVMKNDSLKKFEFKPVVQHKPTTQAEVDSIKSQLLRLPFYRGFVYSEDNKAHLMAITFDQSKLNSKSRIDIVNEIKDEADAFSKANNIELHYSGMPYIRTNFMKMVSKELVMFMVLAFVVTALILYLFFRSFKVVFFAIAVVLIGVIWSVGFLVLFGYKISILTGLIPPLIIVIGIPNSIFIINKYQEEYVKENNQEHALSIAIEKIGKTTFVANLTTFIGFFVFYFTGSPLLLEFGLVAAISVMATWAISLILVPIIFSYLAPPSAKHVQHLDNKRITNFLEWVNFIVHNRRTKLYWFIGALVVISLYGMSQIKANGYVVDDLPESDPIYKDLKFIEKHFHGVVPFEVSIDTKKENGIMSPQLLNKIKVMQREFAKYPEFTNPVSIVEAVKFVYQGYRGGDEKYYQLPGALELQKMADFVGSINTKGKESQFASFVDSTRRYTRVSFQCADAGSARLRVIINQLQPKIDTIFNYDREANAWLPKEEQVEARITGNGAVFTDGNDYLLTNLRDSTLLAIFLVALVMATQFLNFRTILISSIPSIIPLIITAGIMGYFGIPLKPSTTLIFSIAFGIASDGTIYFLTKYKDELENEGKTIREAVTETIMFTGISMFYTAFILFFGFGIFVASSFKGTIFLGLLVSVTLLIGMISNLILLPSFLMTLDKRQVRKQAKKEAKKNLE